MFALVKMKWIKKCYLNIKEKYIHVSCTLKVNLKIKM